MPISVRIARHLDVRLTLANKRELKPFANVPGIRILGNELSSEPLDKQKHLFPDGVDKHHVRKIDNQFQFAVAARDERADFLSSPAGESASSRQVKVPSNSCVWTRSMMTSLHSLAASNGWLVGFAGFVPKFVNATH